MPKKRRQLKRGRSTRSRASGKSRSNKRRGAKTTLKERLARARKLEDLDDGNPTFRVSRERDLAAQPLALAPHPLLNDDFLQTYMQQFSLFLYVLDPSL